MELSIAESEVRPMVMRNRHDGANAPQWWDDLPPEIKKRCANSIQHSNQDPSRIDSDPPDDWFDNPSQTPLRVRRDLSWLALFFVVIAFANLVFLFIAMTFLNGRGQFGN